jgi:RHS repeat-associated protein
VAQSRDHNAVHEITDINESGLTYDARGRLLTDRFGDTYGWGLDGNLLSAASNSGSESDFTYDALGRRATRKAGGTTTAFVYQGDQVIAEYDNGTLARTYVLGLAIDQPIAMRVGSATYYYARQLNGSIHTVMGNDGSVVEQYQYDAYGFRTILAPDGTTRTASTIGNAYGFTGRYHDDAVGIIDFRARAYSPNLGRFLSRDATYANGLSLYAAYFAPDQSDPSGQLSWGDFNPVNVVKTVGNGLEDAGKAVAGAAGDAANAVGNAVTAATGAASNALGSIATSLGNAVTGLAGAAAGAVNTVVGTAEQAASTLGGAVEQGLSDAAKRTIQAITTAVDEAGALAGC